jgi:hypothetical protein
MTTSITKLLKSTQSSSMLAKYLLPVLALLLIVAFSLYLPDTFPTSVTVRSIIDAQAITALLALAEMLVVIAGEYDLSVGYSCGMINILVIGFIVKDHVPLPLTIILALVIGSGLGLINGLLVYVCKIDSFIARWAAAPSPMRCPTGTRREIRCSARCRPRSPTSTPRGSSTSRSLPSWWCSWPVSSGSCWSTPPPVVASTPWARTSGPLS